MVQPIGLHVICGCFCTMMVEGVSEKLQQRSSGPQSQEHLLYDPFWRKFADPWLRMYSTGNGNTIKGLNREVISKEMFTKLILQLNLRWKGQEFQPLQMRVIRASQEWGKRNEKEGEYWRNTKGSYKPDHSLFLSISFWHFSSVKKSVLRSIEQPSALERIRVFVTE